MCPSQGYHQRYPTKMMQSPKSPHCEKKTQQQEHSCPTLFTTRRDILQVGKSKHEENVVSNGDNAH